MASAAPSSHRMSDLGKEQRSPTESGMNFRFVWSAPSPTPDEVADLEERFPEVIQLPPKILSDECGRWSSSALIARSTWRWVQPDSIVREFKRSGVPGEIEAIPLAHRCIIFRCTDPSALALILRRPWVVNGQPIATEAWSSEFIPAADSVSSALLWLRLPRLPMEFWTDQLLRSIVLPAGEFQFSDEATLARRRGGYARVCVRVDLRNPLRPGARIRGSHDPFWQQFSYEHVDGFCSNCGSLHYSNPCSLDPKAGDSTEGAKFGPWLAAVRHRTPVDGGSEQRRKKQGQPSPGSRPAHPSPLRRASSEAGTGASEQWQSPSKTARRREMKKAVFISPETQMAEANIERESVPVFCAGLSQAEPESSLNVGLKASDQALNLGLNPFAALGSTKWDGQPKSSPDARPGPSKRARSDESLIQHVKPKNPKGKGKGKNSGTNPMKTLIINPVVMDKSKDLAATEEETHKAEDSSGKTSALTQMSGLSHDLALSRLRGAISGQDKTTNIQEGKRSEVVTTVSLETACTNECKDQPVLGRNADDEMSEDQDGSHPPPITK